jgi:hypothetical protein
MQQLNSGQEAIMAALMVLKKPSEYVLNSPGTETSSLTHTSGGSTGTAGSGYIWNGKANVLVPFARTYPHKV